MMLSTLPLESVQVRSRRESLKQSEGVHMPPHLARPAFRRLGDLPEAEQKSVTVFCFQNTFFLYWQKKEEEKMPDLIETFQGDGTYLLSRCDHCGG